LRNLKSVANSLGRGTLRVTETTVLVIEISFASTDNSSVDYAE
jgi:hypothetical protein